MNKIKEKDVIRVEISITGWAIAADEREWIYRMSIFYIKKEDSGDYTCTTPKGMKNTISIRIDGKYTIVIGSLYWKKIYCCFFCYVPSIFKLTNTNIRVREVFKLYVLI